MRVSPRVLIALSTAMLVASPVTGQRPDSQISPRSLDLLRQGEAHLTAGRLIEADDALEAALVVDPRNRAAFNALAKVILEEDLWDREFVRTRTEGFGRRIVPI